MQDEISAMLSPSRLSLALGKLALPGHYSKKAGPCLLKRWLPPHTTGQDAPTLSACMFKRADSITLP